MSKTKRYTITAALPYTNGPVHIGHLAGVYIPADIFARYQRLNNREVAFLCGSDEHGVAITLKAKKEGITPKDVVDKFHPMIKKSFEDFGISFDHYSRTSEPIHHKTAQEFFLNLYEKGIFEEKTSLQFYDEEANTFLADRYIKGTCPKCAHTEAYGDQCENCGSSLNADELINPVSVLSGAKPQKKETKHWYLPLDKYQGDLEKWILEEHKEWKPNVYGQCKSWLHGGLHPRPITRDLDWGIQVPIKGADGKVLYVWFDAPIGYISATKSWAGDDWEKWWKSEDSSLIHFIGKDNIVFHCIIFPAMLMAHGDYVLPENVPANEFLNLEGQKISTSRNWAVWLHEYLQDFENQQDVLRYSLCANAPETKDNDFTWKDFQTRNNSELVAIFGNFINRVGVLTHKYYDGEVPTPGKLGKAETDLLASLEAAPGEIGSLIENYKFRDALAAFMQVARDGNKYLAETEPWKLIKTDPDTVKTILFCALQVAGTLAVLSEPFLPFTSDKLSKMLGIKKFSWQDAGKAGPKAGEKINEVALLFSKIEDEQITEQMNRLLNTAKDNKQEQTNTKKIAPMKEAISFDEFQKLDLRLATVESAKRVEKTDKLLELLVDVGGEKRRVVSGIFEHYSPESIIGKQILYLANLAPRKIRGIESQGMILMAEDLDGALSVLSPEKKMPNGAQIR